MSRTLITLAVAPLVALAACGSNGTDLPPEAEAGRAVMRDNGCSSCHGSNGQGGVGPSFKGLFGSEVTLDDGTTITADAAYLRESITDPDAKVVDGYSLSMPTNDLSDAEIDQVIDFIEALAGETP